MKKQEKNNIYLFKGIFKILEINKNKNKKISFHYL